MTLDLSKIASDMNVLAGETADHHAASSFDAVRDAVAEIDSRDLLTRMQSARTSWLLARPVATFQATTPAPAPPTDYTVVASDGSFILPDRHSLARFFVINIGKVVLRYGSSPYAEIDADPSMFFREDELFVPESVRRIPVSGAVLGFKRAAEELASVAMIATAQQTPTIALQDGTLILWGLESQATPVIKWVMEQFRGALDLLKERDIPVASYISFPASSDVANSVRVAVCDYPLNGMAVNCDHCLARVAAESHVPACDFIPNVGDRVLFEQAIRLEPGERSQVFASTSKILDYYDDEHWIHFFYLNSGTEIGRVEIPYWVAADPAKIDLVHAAIYEQCTLGRGYPSALQEAHEIAAIRPDERKAVEVLVEEALARHGLTYRISGKAESKRGRFV